jgi:hypothetical protein
MWIDHAVPIHKLNKLYIGQQASDLLETCVSGTRRREGLGHIEPYDMDAFRDGQLNRTVRRPGIDVNDSVHLSCDRFEACSEAITLVSANGNQPYERLN